MSDEQDALAVQVAVNADLVAKNRELRGDLDVLHEENRRLRFILCETCDDRAEVLRLLESAELSLRLAFGDEVVGRHDWIGRAEAVRSRSR